MERSLPCIDQASVDQGSEMGATGPIKRHGSRRVKERVGNLCGAIPPQGNPTGIVRRDRKEVQQTSSLAAARGEIKP